MKIFYILCALLCAASTVFGQHPIDTTFIKKYPQRISIAGYLSNDYLDIKKDGVLYEPNNLLNLVFGLTVRNTVINLEYDFGIVPLKSSEYGHTKVFDFQIHNYGKNFVLDLTAQNYRGFYYQKNSNTIPVLYPDLAVVQVGVEGTYVFNGDKFSARAAFDQSEEQLQSAGSFVLGGGTYFYRVQDKDQALSNGNSDARNYQIGVNAGYAYSDVLSERWMLSGMLTVGSNFGNQPDLLGDGRIKIYPTAYFRAAGTYHKSDYAVSLSMLLHDTNISNLQDQNIGLLSLYFQLAYVKHIDHFFKKHQKIPEGN